MKNAFLSEIIKLNRKAMRWLLAGMGLVGVLAAGLTIVSASGTDTGLPTPGGQAWKTVEQLSTADGLASILGRIPGLLGALSLAAAASIVATEYSLGTWKNLFVRESRTARLLGGKILGLCTYLFAGALLAVITGTVTSVVFGPSQGIATSLWTSSNGFAAFGSALLNILLSSLGYGAIGIMLAVIFKSPGASIGAGLAYILPGEQLLGTASSALRKFLPGQVFNNVAAGGSPDVPYGKGVFLLLQFVLLFVGVSIWKFRRADQKG